MKDDFVRRHAHLFQPVELAHGEIKPLNTDVPLDLIQYFSNSDYDEPLRALFAQPLLVFSVVPAEHAFKTYDDQINFQNQIGNQLVAHCKSFQGIVFHASGRICGIFSLRESGTETLLQASLREAIASCIESLHCMIHGVSSGPWEDETELTRIFFFMDEVWNYFNFLTDKPSIYHVSPQRVQPKIYEDWSACWLKYHGQLVRAIQEKDRNGLLKTGSQLISEVLIWGAPSVIQVLIHINQIFNNLITELYRKNMLGIRNFAVGTEYYESSLQEIERETALRVLVEMELKKLYTMCQEYELQKNEQFIQDIKQYIERNLPDYNLSVSTISRHFHVSANTLSAKFRAANQTNIAEYIHIRRVARMKALLISSDMPVDQIMEVVGFFSRSTMYRAFTRLTGMAPKDYKATYLNQKNEALE